MISYDILLVCILTLVVWVRVRLARVVEAHQRQLERQGRRLSEAIEDYTRVLEHYTRTVHTITTGMSPEEIDA